MPDWSKSAHSFEMALALAKACQAAYCKAGEPSPEDWANSQGFEAPTRIEAGPSFGFTAAKGDILLIAFRGTNEREDWRINIDMDRKAVPGIDGQVHDGFWDEGLQPLLPGIQNVLNSRPFRKIWITGHSLGGAIAVLCQAALIFEHNRMITGVYTFGQPRAGDSDFRDQLDEKTTGQYHRYVNHNDIVPLVPLHSQGYRHAGTPLRFDRNGKPERHDGLFTRVRGFLDHLEDQLESALRLDSQPDLRTTLRNVRNAPAQGVREHGIKEYIALIEKALAA